MSAFADYLRSLGTADADIAVLDTPAAQKAYDKMVADSDARVAAEKAKLDTYQERVNKYYTDAEAEAQKIKAEAIAARGEAARARAAILEMQKQGLIENAKNYGFDPESAPAAPAKPEPKYLTADDIMPSIDAAGDGLAQVMDAMVEHNRLFPDKPFNARAIRNEAVAAKKSFYTYWEEKYGVRAARDTFEAAQKKAYEDKLRKEGADAKAAELASLYANPMTRPASASVAPFVIKRTSDGKPEVPWARSENELSDARVRKATENLIKRGEQATH